ncbi:DUF1439 domain-containing protein [Marinomonas posidonica]|uniref:DUF1439 domain-containing protein n=1 Tax=Marinomonas posidonica TaxID=936476 RepID=UPI00373672F4
MILIKKSLNLSLLALLCLTLTACNSFRISESKINDDLTKQIETAQDTRFELAAEGQAVALNLAIRQANVDFLERDGGVIAIALMCDLTGEVSAFGQNFSLTTQVNPEFEAGIRLQDQDLFLVAPRLTQVAIKGSSFDERVIRTALGSLQDRVEQVLRQYFDQHPIYTLDHSPFEKLAASLVSNIEIKDDSLELSMF